MFIPTVELQIVYSEGQTQSANSLVAVRLHRDWVIPLIHLNMRKCLGWDIADGAAEPQPETQPDAKLWWLIMLADDQTAHRDKNLVNRVAFFQTTVLTLLSSPDLFHETGFSVCISLKISAAK